MNKEIDKEKKLAERLYKKYKISAAKRKHNFTLPFDFFEHTIKEPCFYCGMQPSNIIRNSSKKDPVFLKYNGLDRMDSKIGYVTSNVIPSCKFCNGLKGRMSFTKWGDFINGVVRTHQGAVPFGFIKPLEDRGSGWKGF